MGMGSLWFWSSWICRWWDMSSPDTKSMPTTIRSVSFISLGMEVLFCFDFLKFFFLWNWSFQRNGQSWTRKTLKKRRWRRKMPCFAAGETSLPSSTWPGKSIIFQKWPLKNLISLQSSEQTRQKQALPSDDADGIQIRSDTQTGPENSIGRNWIFNLFLLRPLLVFAPKCVILTL